MVLAEDYNLAGGNPKNVNMVLIFLGKQMKHNLPIIKFLISTTIIIGSLKINIW